MEVKVSGQHRWLQRMTGSWISQADDQGEGQGMWDETIRSVGDIWIEAEGKGDMPDGKPGMTLLTIGYDPARGKFVGSFVGSMMTHHWVYEGDLDDSETVLTLNTEGPEFGTGSIRRFRDIIEYDGGSRRVFRSEMEEDSGEWTEIMRTTFVRSDIVDG